MAISSRKLLLLTLMSIFIVSLLFRALPKIDSPFWIDEFNSASQARVIGEKGLKAFSSNIRVEKNNFVSYALIAVSFKVLGESETSARLPFVLIGSLVPVLLFLVGKKIYGDRVGIIAALLAICSYIQITWSQQARGYILQQFWVLLVIYLYYQLLRSKNNKIYAVLIPVICLVGFFIHFIFGLLIVALICHALYENIQNRYIKKTSIVLIFFLLFLILIGVLVQKEWGTIMSSGALFANNFGYYHSFFWREYTLVTFLSLIGLILSLLHKKDRSFQIFIFTYLIFHFVFVVFIFADHITKYVLPIFPLLFLFAAVALDNIARLFIEYLPTRWHRVHVFTGIFLAIFIIINGDKFTIKPKPYYSVNAHFREIATLDYDRVYDIIKHDAAKNPAVIETWIDRARWYLGNDYEHIFYFRWEQEPGKPVNRRRQTEYIMVDGMKVIPDNRKVGFMSTVRDLKKIMEMYDKGFLFIDDSSLPQDVIQYAEINLKKELYLDHYPLDPNPYSIWPATLYSWGSD